MITALAVGPVRLSVIVSKAWLKGRAVPPAAKAVPASAASAVAAASPLAIHRADIEVLLRLKSAGPGPDGPKLSAVKACSDDAGATIQEVGSYSNPQSNR